MYFVPIHSFVDLLGDLISALIILIIAEALVTTLAAFSGNISRYNPFIRTLQSIVDPILNPIRKFLPPPSRTMNMDISPIIAIIILEAIRRYL